MGPNQAAPLGPIQTVTATNVLAALPKSAHPGAKKALAEIYNAENKQLARKAAKAFADEYGTKWAKAAAKITDDLDVLLAFYDFPAEHWVHLRTTNPIESDLRDRAVAAAGHQRPPAPARPVSRWRSNSSSPPSAVARLVNAPHLVALVRAGAEFKDGKLVERPDESGGEDQAA